MSSFHNAVRIFPVCNVATNGVGDNVAANYLLQDIETAKQCGADGIFLKNYTRGEYGVMKMFEMISFGVQLRPDLFGDFFVGGNFSGIDKLFAARLCKNLEALWVDDPGFVFNPDANMSDWIDTYAASLIREKLATFPKKPQFWASVFLACKNPSGKNERKYVINAACDRCNILVFNGNSVELDSSLKEIKIIRDHISNDKRLAVSGGFDISNLEYFVDVGATDFLVANSINKKDDVVIDPDKLSALIEKARRCSL